MGRSKRTENVQDKNIVTTGTTDRAILRDRETMPMTGLITERTAINQEYFRWKTGYNVLQYRGQQATFAIRITGSPITARITNLLSIRTGKLTRVILF